MTESDLRAAANSTLAANKSGFKSAFEAARKDTEKSIKKGEITGAVAFGPEDPAM